MTMGLLSTIVGSDILKAPLIHCNIYKTAQSYHITRVAPDSEIVDETLPQKRGLALFTGSKPNTLSYLYLTVYSPCSRVWQILGYHVKEAIR